MATTTLTKSQKRSFTKELDDGSVIVANVRYDDECGNGHNTFSITADMYDRGFIRGEASVVNSHGKRRYLGSCGCLHDEVAKHFPELSKYIRWHLVSSDAPMHYLENSMYWAGHRGWCGGKENDPPNFEHLKSTCCYGASNKFDHDLEDFWRDAPKLTQWLTDRLDDIQAEFRNAVEELGFKF